MIESNLEEGRQDVLEGQSLVWAKYYRCLRSMADTEPLLHALAEACQRRALRA